MNIRKLTQVLLAMLLIGGSVVPSWAWVRGGWGGRGGGWGWRGGGGWGWRGGTNIWIGAPGPWWWGGYPYPYVYPYDPYPYYPYDTDLAYTPPNETESEQAAPQPIETAAPRGDLGYLDNQIARQRSYLKYQYEDGDISKDQLTGGMARLDAVQKKAQTQAEANGGTLNTEQENTLLDEIGAPHAPSRRSFQVGPRPSPPEGTPRAGGGRHDLTEVSDLLLELRTLLDQKLKDGDITKAQCTAEKDYLTRIEHESRTEVDTNGGHLTDEQQDYWVQELHHAYYSINHNLIIH